jgi:hypothetical protein
MGLWETTKVKIQFLNEGFCKTERAGIVHAEENAHTGCDIPVRLSQLGWF